jgi:hypothetical protein
MDTGTINFEVCFNCGTGPALFFYADFGQQIGSNCTTITSASGDCQYSACADPGFTGASAGTLSLTGGPFADAMLPPSPTDDSYTFYPNSMVLPVGQTVSVSATGATVPAFGPDFQHELSVAAATSVSQAREDGCLSPFAEPRSLCKRLGVLHRSSFFHGLPGQ